jgi:4-amino-4-deoxy-L-arabinose transferase-like glycosyltransferase
VNDAQPSPPRERLALALCVLAAVALRMARWERTAVLFNDGPVFLALAEHAAAGQLETLLQHPFHPLYPLLVAALHAVGAPFGLGLETAGALVSALAGGAAVLALHGFVRRAFGPREGLVAAWLLAFHAGAVDSGGDVQSEALYLALFLAAAAALWRALTEARVGAAFAAGAFAGLAYLTRPEGLGVALVGLGLVAIYTVRRRFALRRGVALAAAVAAGSAALALPYAAALSAESGRLELTRKKSVGWVVGSEGHAGSGGLATGQAGMEAPKIPGAGRWRLEVQVGGVVPSAGAAPPGGGSDAAAKPEEVGPDPYDSLVAPPWTPRGALAATRDLLDDSAGALRPEMLALVLAGVFFLRGRPGRRAGFVAALVGAYGALLFALAMNVGYVSERHALPPLLLLLGYGAAGALALGRALARLRGTAAGSERRARLATALLLAGVAAICLGKTLRRGGLEDVAERRAAEWVRAHAPGSVVAARKRRVAYYAGAPFVQLRPKTARGFDRYFEDHGVRFVVVNRADVPEYIGLDDLVDVRRLEEVERIEAEGEVALVYAYHPVEPPR